MTTTDPLAELRAACDYDPEGEASMDALIAYKNALEELAVRQGAALSQIAADVPREDEWHSAVDFMGDAAETLDVYDIERPEHYQD